MEIQNIRKRDGSVQPFDIVKIENAIAKALAETGEGNRESAKDVAELAHQKVVAMCVQAGTAAPDDPLAKKCIDGNPAVEEIQDLVEQALIERCANGIFLLSAKTSSHTNTQSCTNT
jgi:hypothetical protein